MHEGIKESVTRLFLDGYSKRTIIRIVKDIYRDLSRTRRETK